MALSLANITIFCTAPHRTHFPRPVKTSLTACATVVHRNRLLPRELQALIHKNY